MSEPYKHLIVIWRLPEDGTRYVVGDLRRAAGGFTFAYRSEARSLVENGFVRPAEFPDWRYADAPYRSPYLFSTFSQRVPSPKRPDYARMMTAWGVERADDVMEVLAKSGGLLPTDALELAEHRNADDPLEDALEFRIAGQGHHRGAEELREGSAVTLIRDPENAHDAFAVAVRTESGRMAGYVPRYYSEFFSRKLAQGPSLRARAVRRGGPRAEPWVVRVTAA